MPEVGGEAVLYFNPYHVEDIADKVNLLLNDKEIVATLNENRIKQLQKLSVHNTATRVHTIYQSTLGGI
jgi:glycosyltransferase involved in cell wall biosynthesis